MRRRYLIPCLAALLMAVPAMAAPQPWEANEVRNLRLEYVQEANGDITFIMRWVSPQRTGRQSPVTGYEWRFGHSGDSVLNLDGEWDQPLATGSTNAETREVSVTITLDCTTDLVWYGGEVRALGGWAAEDAPWGASPMVELECEPDHTPPGPPTVTLDTLPRDTTGTPTDPDPAPEYDSLAIGSITLRDDQPYPPGTFRWAREGLTLNVRTIGGVVDSSTVGFLCAYFYRGAEIVGVANDPACLDTEPVQGLSVPLTHLTEADWPTVPMAVMAGGS